MTTSRSIIDQTVRSIMTKEVRTLGRNDELTLADEAMREDAIRHMPVLDEEGRLCGILSQRDIFRGALLRALGFGGRAEEKQLASLVVKDAMTRDPVTIGPDEPVGEAARRMLERKVGCLPVVEDEKLLGIVTASDLLRVIA